ncbi:PQQ enzyme repeat protein [Botrimarina colliarenosi]|uniref:PQQ enzyme repeat protein n=1 Tax=Botrimarina colliarenosi TaxID=2528001 RepID=A0A5C6AE59_9BACT|nr:PQQ-binding-like beta-propeller repeat protein [Botrimarina colliarenosi]TWT97706.1 PQQ enzyme repeat protein [Botrimarina colliarenosi]
MRTDLCFYAVAAAAVLTPIAHAASPAAPGRPLLAADASAGRIALLAADGAIEWEHPIGAIHDLQLLPNGNVLFQTSWTRIVEIDPATGDVVWEYDSASSNGNSGKRVEVHSFQRLPNGDTMIAESGPARLIEVGPRGELRRQIPLKVDHPDPHHDTRLARRLPNGHYLVAHEGDGAVREYDAQGAVVWEYAVPLFGKAPRGGHDASAWGAAVFAAERLPNGNTLIATGNGHSVLEVTPEKEIVWRLKQDDLPGITLAWVTTLQPLPNGNLILGNCHAGADNPQIIEVTRDKQVVWQFKDFERFGDALSNSYAPAAEDE